VSWTFRVPFVVCGDGRDDALQAHQVEGRREFGDRIFDWRADQRDKWVCVAMRASRAKARS
jgi:hypothetical protein